MPPKSSKWKPVGESFSVDGSASAYQTYACLRCGKEFKSRVGAQAQFAKGTDPSRPWTDRTCDQGMAACDACECVPAEATSSAEAAASSVVTAAGSRAEAAASSSSGVVEVAANQARVPAEAVARVDSLDVQMRDDRSAASRPLSIADAASSSMGTHSAHRTKRSISEVDSYELCEDVRHNIRQLSEDEWIAGGAVRFRVTATKRKQLERNVRLSHAPVAGLDLLGTGDAPPPNAHSTVVVAARAAASVEIIGQPSVQLAVAEACAFDAALIVRLRGDAVVLHFGLLDCEEGKSNGKARRRARRYADIPSMEDDRHNPAGDATSPTPAEQCVAAAEERAKAAEERAKAAEERARAAEQRETAAEERAKAAEERATTATDCIRTVEGAGPKRRATAQRGDA